MGMEGTRTERDGTTSGMEVALTGRDEEVGVGMMAADAEMEIVVHLWDEQTDGGETLEQAACWCFGGRRRQKRSKQREKEKEPSIGRVGKGSCPSINKKQCQLRRFR